MASDRKAQLAEVNHWDDLLAIRDRQREQYRHGIQIIKESELPLEVSRQGLLRWYLHPAIKDTCLSVLMFFQQEIPPGSRSGRLKFQGGQVMMITEGRGYTVIDGVKHPWKAGDVVNLPLRANGIIVQHFNADQQQPAKFVAVEPNWVEGVSMDRGCGFEQLEDAPEYRRKALAERNLTGPVVIDCTKQEWFQARQGKLKFFLDPVSFKDTPLQQWRVFIHDIKTRSGKHRHQGGLVIYVLEGKGYSIVEGERKDWEKGDLVLLPMKPGGVEHQHFNSDPSKPAIWAAFINIPIQEYLASDLKQEEVSPDFKE